MSKQLAFVFPGQGSQEIGMLTELANTYPIVIKTFAEASEQLQYDLWQLVQQGPADVLNQTVHTQPALLAAGVAIWRVWQEKNGRLPGIMAGHSLGEYTALVCAQALKFSDAVKLVAQRGRLMQAAVPSGEGAMAAIVGLDNQKVCELCECAVQGEMDSRQIVSPANYNALGQVVISGHRQAVEQVISKAKEAGAKIAKMLPVSVPSHSALMRTAAEQFTSYLTDISCETPQIPVINNVDVAIYTESKAIKEALIRQLYSPVRWVETIQLMAKKGIEFMVECGPGKVLTGLTKRIESSILTVPINDSASLTQALTQLKI